MKTYVILLSCTILFLIPVKATAQDQDLNPVDIFKEAAKVCEQTQSIQYRIQSKGIDSYKGLIDFNSEVTMQRAEVKDLGFGKTLLKISAVRNFKQKEEEFSYTYDGGTFKFQNKTKNIIKSINEPEMTSVLRVLGMEYGLVHSSEYFMEKPFEPYYTYKGREGSRFDSIIFLGEEQVRNTNCYKLKVVSEGRDTYWWFSCDDYRVYKLRTSIAQKEIFYIAINKTYEKDYFALDETGTENEKVISGNEADTLGLLKPESIAPGFELLNLEGQKVTLEEYKGKVVLLDFWGTWCLPCKKSMPHYQKLSQRYKSKGLEVIGISVRSKEEDVRSFISIMGFSYTFLLNGENVAKDYQVQMYPSIYILDRKGRIVHAERGSRQNQYAEIERILENTLK